MRNSCNGCRVLRRGCGADCCIRPSIQWINSPESQAHATIFLAKFYGRAGLINLINAGPEHQRPDIFRSMLYEACGRIVDPVDGSAGLMWSGNWHLCQAAVDSVLQGVSITPTNSSPVATEEPTLAPPLQVYDIRHVSKRANDESGPSDNFNRAVKNRAQFEHKTRSGSFSTKPDSTGLERSNPTWCYPVEFPQTPSHENERVLSAESSHLSQAEAFGGAEVEENGLELELRLGFQPVCG